MRRMEILVNWHFGTLFRYAVPQHQDAKGTSMRYGYARVSTKDQCLETQIEALQDAGCDLIRTETITGTMAARDRPELSVLLEFAREGDSLVVVRLDRLGRSTRDVLEVVQYLTDQGIGLETLDGLKFDGSATGKLFLTMLSAFAEFDYNLRRERQLEGIERAKSQGVYKGRKRSIDRELLFELHRSGLGPAAIAKELNIGRTSVYRCLAEAPDQDISEHS